MKKASTTHIISLISGLSAVIAVFCMFAAAFNEDPISVRGSVFTIMFPASSSGYNVVIPLVIGLVLLLSSAILSFLSLALNGKTFKLLAGGQVLITVASGVLFLMAPGFYEAANGISLETTGSTSIGMGLICVAVFAFISTALNLLALVLKDGAESGTSTIKKKA